ncbi:hypothetical protein HPB48_020473 [Haemaphysalis longicornis]|uniref:Annexin n=1 Tax=Haemaphysalis longicornis TaxID=44386 RepID=A0A9J6F6Z7_HAELO|nr:hypothetical protein HPB48_020473 [Haemaphysalis longicornis]
MAHRQARHLSLGLPGALATRSQVLARPVTLCREDLIADIKSELRGRFEDVMVGLLYPMHEYLARELRRAVAGLGTDEDCLIEILCTRSNEDIRLMKQYYRTCESAARKNMVHT